MTHPMLDSPADQSEAEYFTRSAFEQEIATTGAAIRLEMLTLWTTANVAPIGAPDHVPSADRSGTMPLPSSDVIHPFAVTTTVLEFDRKPADLDAVVQAWLEVASSAGSAMSCFIFRNSLNLRDPFAPVRPDRVYAYCAGSLLATALDDGYRGGARWARAIEKAWMCAVPTTAPLPMPELATDADADADVDDRLKREICRTSTSQLMFVTFWPTAEASAILPPAGVTAARPTLYGPLARTAGRPYAAMAQILEFNTIPCQRRLKIDPLASPEN